MLYLEKKYIPPPALSILSQLQKDKTLDDFFLVGGTALALQLGHRLSVDIDLFIDKPFDTQQLLSHLSTTYGFQASTIFNNTLLGFMRLFIVGNVLKTFGISISCLKKCLYPKC